MCRKINKDNECQMKQIKNIWLERSVEVHCFVHPDPRQFWNDKLGEFLRDTKRAEGYVYEKDGLVKGFVTWKNRNDCIYIFELFAYKSGEGIGPKLLNKVKELNNSKPLVLDVYVLNIGSVNWYSKSGFVIQEIRECNDKDLEVFKCEKERLKYKMRRLKYRMIRLPQKA
jgi:hypothetical protein